MPKSDDNVRTIDLEHSSVQRDCESTVVIMVDSTVTMANLNIIMVTMVSLA